jgi:hypothetical protein
MMTTDELRRTARAYDKIATATKAAAAEHGYASTVNALFALMTEYHAHELGIELDGQFVQWLAALRQEGKLK